MGGIIIMNCSQLFNNILKSKTLIEVAKELKVSKTTIQRWVDNNQVPERYIFDLHRYIDEETDYTKFSPQLKDQFFTPPSISLYCLDVIKTKIPDYDLYTFIEPSAGDGSFSSILPDDTISLDVEPRNINIKKQDFLKWKPEDKSKKYIVVGNPPFGLRGHLALKFINHSIEFADYVCFILPQLFESDGKGSPMKRVENYNLIHSEKISGMFSVPEDNDVKINGVFQIWSKHSSDDRFRIKENGDNNVKVYSLSDGGTPSSTRNKKMLDKCDIYLPSTCFGKEVMRVYDSFSELPGKKGYGVVFKNDKKKYMKLSKEIDWSSVAFLSTNSAYNLRTSLIINIFI